MRECKRCGKLHETNLENSAQTWITIMYPTARFEAITLCPECEAELLAWIEKGVNNGKTELFRK